MALSGETVIEPQSFLLEHQSSDGRWLADKWHSSWLYTTLEVILALDQINCHEVIQPAVEALLVNQHQDGGWGMSCKSTTIETAYSVLALYVLWRRGLLSENARNALKRGFEWLLSQYCSSKLENEDKYWIGKELYKPYRVDRIFELSAMLAIVLAE